MNETSKSIQNIFYNNNAIVQNATATQNRIYRYIKQDRKTNKSPTDTQTHMPITLQCNQENQFSLFSFFLNIHTNTPRYDTHSYSYSHLHSKPNQTNYDFSQFQPHSNNHHHNHISIPFVCILLLSRFIFLRLCIY